MKLTTLISLLSCSIGVLAQAEIKLPVIEERAANTAPQDPQLSSALNKTVGTVISLQCKFIVIDELTIKPVPLTSFRITSIVLQDQPEAQADKGASIARTDEHGVLSLELPAGHYRIESISPLHLKNKTYTWSQAVEVKPKGENSYTFTDADAKVSNEPFPAQRQVADEAKIYRAFRGGVATVESERGHGTAFLVDARDVLLTNQHVVEGSRRLVVRFRPGLRVQAQIIASDAVSDVAVLRIHPDAAQGLPALVIEPAESTPVLEGERILTIGSPLGEEKVLTTGLVARVKDDVIISDININPGNSGGPLLNMSGHVVGLTTFGESATQGGAGLSGIVAMSKVRPVLDTGLKSIGEDASEGAPDSRLLADFPATMIPAEALNQAARTDLQVPIIKAPKAFETRFYTPFIAASIAYQKERELARKKNKRRDKQGPQGLGEGGKMPVRRFYDGDVPRVQIAVAPRLVESKSSKRRGLFGALLGGATGVFVPSKRDMEFRHDFNDMELWRDGKLVEPLQRQRVPVSIYYDFGFVEAKDSAHAGVYSYDPAAFRPGGKLVLRVQREYNVQAWDEVNIPEKLRANLYNQFAPYYKAVNSVAAAAAAQAAKILPQPVTLP